MIGCSLLRTGAFFTEFITSNFQTELERVWPFCFLLKTRPGAGGGGLWDIEVEELAEAILWDRDFDDARLYIDFPLEKSNALKSIAGISDDYYIAIAEDLTDDQAHIKIKQLQNLCKLIF